jgi:CheY-like chemotaxis protein
MLQPLPSVLLIDAYTDERELYAEFLRYSGCPVEEAESGRQAIRKALALRPEVIATDLMLKDMDGLDLVRQFRGHQATRSTPLIVLTGYAFEQDVQRAREAGCDAVLVKPCLPAQLLREITRLLRHRAQQLHAQTRRILDESKSTRQASAAARDERTRRRSGE